MKMSAHEMPHTIRINPLRKSLSNLPKQHSTKKDQSAIFIQDASE